MLVSLVPLTDTPEAQSRSGLERLHLRKHCHKKNYNSTYLITSTITLAVVSPRVVMHEPHLTSNKDHHHGEAVAPSAGVSLVVLLNPTQDRAI